MITRNGYITKAKEEMKRGTQDHDYKNESTPHVLRAIFYVLVAIVMGQKP